MEFPILRKRRIFDLGVNIDAYQTEDVDSIPLVSFISCNYFIEVLKLDGSVATSFDMKATRRGADVYDTVYNRIGGPPKISVKFLISGPDAVLRIENQESYTVAVRGVRLNHT